MIPIRRKELFGAIVSPAGICYNGEVRQLGHDRLLKKDKLMEKVTQIPASPMDVFLLPVWVHKRISIRLPGLLLAFGFVGAFDLLAFYPKIVSQPVFTGSIGTFLAGVLVFLCLSLIVGTLDVVCTMYPISDFARMIGRRSEKYVNKHISVILMKSYALSHLLLLVPIGIFNYAGIDWDTISPATPGAIKLLFAFIVILIEFLPYFQLGILYRTLSIRTRIQVFGKLILILAAYFWMQISSTAMVFFGGLAYAVLASL